MLSEKSNSKKKTEKSDKIFTKVNATFETNSAKISDTISSHINNETEIILKNDISEMGNNDLIEINPEVIIEPDILDYNPFEIIEDVYGGPENWDNLPEPIDLLESDIEIISYNEINTLSKNKIATENNHELDDFDEYFAD